MTAAGSRDPAGAAAYRAWRRPLLRERSRSGAEAAYVLYVTAFVAAVYGSMLWSFLASLGLGSTSLTWPLGRVAPIACGLAAVGGVALARVGLPLSVTAREAVFALGGQFRPDAVLRGRGALALVAAAVVGAFVGAAASVGGRASGVQGIRGVLVWAALGAAAGEVAVALGAVAQARRWRRSADAAALALLALGVAAAPGERAEPAIACVDLATGQYVACPVPWTEWAGALAVAGLAVVGAWWLVLRAVPRELDVDEVAARGARAGRAAAGLALGDLLAVSRLIPARFAGSRRPFEGGGARSLLRRTPVLARDLVGLRRRPATTAAATVAGVGGAWLLAASTSTGALVAGALALYAASGGWARGLVAFLRQPAPGGLLPGRGRRVLLAHLDVPALAAGLALLIGWAGAALTVGTRGAAGDAVALGAVALAARAWVASTPTVPAALYAPVITPLGDLSPLNVIAFAVRGWLVVAAAAWALGGVSGAVGGPALAALVAAGLGALAAQRAERA
ncbi:hypothetical protein [Xylanimonas ulmi]|uniref:Uncharacterized protein n=1 Tax=Xylanimonas ulmi TaxID=228973 RepID=A0A4Q7M1F0_9MICO|nr:hypothetical protein [Xylanibacterium ulmi]RZS60607.1 hypothetical protein EV386_0876 [Xylanibacterium ulmi]